MPIYTSFDHLQAIADTLNQAETPRLGAEMLAKWLGDNISRALVGVFNTQSSGLTLAISPGYKPVDELLAWVNSTEAWSLWQSWEAPYWLDAENPITNLEITGPALLIPLRYEGYARG